MGLFSCLLWAPCFDVAHEEPIPQEQPNRRGRLKVNDSGVQSDTIKPSRNTSSALVMVLLISVSIDLILYMTYPSLQTTSSTTKTYSSTAVLYSTNSIEEHSRTTKTTYSTSCLLNDCYDYPPYPISYTTAYETSFWISSVTSFQVTNYKYATNYWTSAVPPYAYIGSSKNQLPTGVAILTWLIIASPFIPAYCPRQWESGLWR